MYEITPLFYLFPKDIVYIIYSHLIKLKSINIYLKQEIISTPFLNNLIYQYTSNNPLNNVLTRESFTLSTIEKELVYFITRINNEINLSWNYINDICCYDDCKLMRKRIFKLWLNLPYKYRHIFIMSVIKFL